ncbi:MAG TPA: methylmalonyl-CoA epimerase [Herpetosiphonaceae bacterium]
MKRIDHLGLAVRDLDAAVALYGALFGMAEWERIELPERHMAVAVARVGGALLELITPTSDEAAFAKFLAERGEGVHHVAYEVDDIEAALAALEQAGARLIDRVPRPGIHGTRIAFLHPKAAAGVLIELVELPAAGAESSH